MRHTVRRSAAAVIIALACGNAVAGAGSTPITVQIVNDSGLPDSQVFLLLKASPVPMTSGPVVPVNVSGEIPVIDTSTNAVKTSAPLGCPASNPPPGCVPFTRAKGPGGIDLTVDSPYSGANSLPVYQFRATSVSSGVLYVSYNGTITAPPAPTVTANVRFQPVEFTYYDQIPSTADLSSIDFYGIPVEITTFKAGDVHFRRPLSRASYYTSTPTLLQSMIATSTNLSAVMIAANNQPFVPGTTDMSQFLRVLGPPQVAAPWTTSPLPVAAPAGAAHVWPYPSFAAYLDSLVGTYTFVEQGGAPISGYSFTYTGQVLRMTPTTTDTCLNPQVTVDGWYVKLTGTTSSNGSLPANADICVPLPKHNPQSVNASLANSGNADFVIYGAPQNCETLGISQSGAYMPCSDSDGSVLTLTNSVYGYIQADVLAALNFGYMNGKWDQTSNNGKGLSTGWFGLPPVSYPFGQARVGNDGYYNPWAAMMYNHSDAYGFAFSDRPGRVSPDIALPTDGGTLRIWILPDSRLDAPLVEEIDKGNTHIKVRWPRVSGAHHYEVSWTPPLDPTAVVIDQPAAGTAYAEYKIEKLQPGTPYTISVRAIAASERLASMEVPVNVTTTGSPGTPPAGNVEFMFGFNWTPPSYMSPPPQVTIGGATGTWQALTQGGMGYVMTGTTPYTVSPPGSTAILNVSGTCPGNQCITQSLSSAAVAPGGTATVTVNISDSTPGATSLVPTSAFVFLLPPGSSATLDTTQTTCGNVVVSGASIVSGTGSTVPLSASSTSCAIVATVTMPSTAGVYATGFGANYFTLNGTTTNTPPSLGVLVGSPPAAGANISQTIAPATVAPGGAATLTITLGPPGAPVDLAIDFVDVLPAGMTVTSLGAANTCPAVSASGNTISIPTGTTIPAAGCAIVANVTATTAGAAQNATGMLILTNTPMPVASFPLVITQNGTTIWESNVYLTMLGTPQGFAVGPCTPLDDCAGSGLANVVPFDTAATPNFADRLTQPLNPLGGRANQPGTPFDVLNPATIGLSFVPIPDKKPAAVVVPVGLGSTNLCPWLPLGMVCP